MLPVVRNNNPLVPTTAGRPANRLSSLIERFFNDDIFTPLTTPAWTSLPLSMWEDDQNVHVEVDAPGLTEKDIDVSVHQGELLIQGERKEERKEGGWDTRSFGRFEQRMTLPAPVDAEKVEARLANGVLSITFPKSEEAKPRKIALKTE